MRFREHKYAISADIEGMFMQVGLLESDQRSLRFLWREDPTSDVSVFQYTRNIFGAKDSPTCANYALRRTAVDNQDRYPDAACAVLNNFYMDDYLWSVKNPETALRLSRSLVELLKLGGFNLTKVLSDDVKLTYLKTLVSGKAKNAIAEFAYSGVFYKNALKTLERKFGQPQTIVAAHLEKLSNFPPLKMHNSESIISFASCISSLVAVLKSLGYEYDLKSTSVLNQVISKLPPNMKESRSLHSVKKCWRQPIVLDFNDWLRDKAEAHELMRVSQNKSRPEETSKAADIEGMFMQVGLLESDQRSLRFLWREDPTSDVSVFQYTRNIFGAKDSPTCANYALRRTAVDNQDRYPDAACAVLNNFYMDDYLWSVKNPETALRLSRSLVELLKLGGFNLTKIIISQFVFETKSP